MLHHSVLLCSLVYSLDAAFQIFFIPVFVVWLGGGGGLSSRTVVMLVLWALGSFWRLALRAWSMSVIR